MIDISVIIPAYNEEKNLSKTLHKVSSILTEYNNKLNVEFIIIDDGSKDNTWETIKNISLQHGNHQIYGIKFYRNFGKEAAIEAGLKKSRGNAVILLDADGEHSPEIIPEMLDYFNKGFLLVEAIKKTRQKETYLKRIFVKLYFKLFKILTGLDIKNLTDFKLLSREMVNIYLKNFQENKKFFRGIIKWTGIKTKKIYFHPSENNLKNKSSWNIVKLLIFGWNNIVSFSIIPLRLLLLIGLVGIIFGCFLLIQTLYYKLTGKSAEGFTTVIILQILFNSGILFSIGILGEYVGKIYEEIKRRPAFLIEEEFKI